MSRGRELDNPEAEFGTILIDFHGDACNGHRARGRHVLRSHLAERAPRNLAIGPPGHGRSAGRDRGLSRLAHRVRRRRRPMRPRISLASERVDCAGRWITPGLIDCHTHLIHAGDRSHEFELRLRGSSYDEIARAGGGILSTMRATRAASEEALVESALGRLDALIAEGVTTVEVKSGYGLDLDTERKQLRAARALERRRPVTIVATFLGAHALPPEAADADAYIDLVCTRDDSRSGRGGPRGDGGRFL